MAPTPNPTAPSPAQLGSPTTSSAARLMQQLVDARAGAGMAPGSAPRSNAVRARMPVRHSMDGASRQLESMARSLTVIPGARRCVRVGFCCWGVLMIVKHVLLDSACRLGTAADPQRISLALHCPEVALASTLPARPQPSAGP